MYILNRKNKSWSLEVKLLFEVVPKTALQYSFKSVEYFKGPNLLIFFHFFNFNSVFHSQHLPYNIILNARQYQLFTSLLPAFTFHYWPLLTSKYFHLAHFAAAVPGLLCLLRSLSVRGWHFTGVLRWVLLWRVHVMRISWVVVRRSGRRRRHRLRSFGSFGICNITQREWSSVSVTNQKCYDFSLKRIEP